MNAIILALIITINAGLNAQQDHSPLYFCTAADTQYFYCLKQLIGSIHNTNFAHTAEIAVFNLGFSQEEVSQLNAMAKVKVYDVEMTHPDLLKHFCTGSRHKRGWYAWKPVAIKQALDQFPYVLWLDAGCVVFKPLDNLFQHIQQNGYFLYSSEHKMLDYTTKTIAQTFNLHQEDQCSILQQQQMESGMQGICKSDPVAYQQYLLPAYEMSKELHTYFSDDGSAPKGFGMARHDQALCSILARLNGMEVQEGYCKPTKINLHINNEEIPFSIDVSWPPVPQPDTDVLVQVYGNIRCEQHIIYR